MTTNIGLEFNKRVYLNLRKQDWQNMDYRKDNMQLYKILVTTKLADLEPNKLNLSDKIDDRFESFSLTTSGQGFLIGTGNEHGTGAKVKVNGKDVESHEFKMGFHFDHSTGIPVITGHNLKGRIRSFFPIAYKQEYKKNTIAIRLIADIKDCFKDDNTISEWSKSEIIQLENIIFEGKFNKDNRINPLKQDTFFGAYPSKSNSKEFSYSLPEHYVYKNKKGEQKDRYDKEYNVKVPDGTFLFDDTLAHHPHPLKDPMPIRLLKILPDVEITFQFRLNDEGGLTGKQKATLFKFLLKKYGAGAKTSTGYGQFKKSIEIEKSEYSKMFLKIDMDTFKPINLEQSEIYPDNDTIDTSESPKIDDSEWPEGNTLNLHDTLNATVIEHKSGAALVMLHIKGMEIKLNVQGKIGLNIKKIKVMVIETSGKVKKGNYTISKVSLVDK